MTFITVRVFFFFTKMIIANSSNPSVMHESLLLLVLHKMCHIITGFTFKAFFHYCLVCALNRKSQIRQTAASSVGTLQES